MPANPNWGDITVTTLHKRQKMIEDNVTNNNALLTHLKKSGNMKKVSGGESIIHELSYNTGRYNRYQGYGILDISPTDMFSAAEYDWKQSAVPISMSGLEELKNAGNERMIDLLEERIKNAEATMANGVAEDIYGDGTADGGLALGGLQLLVAAVPTNTAGGISGSAYPFWQNYVYDFSDASVTPSATTITAAMNLTWMNTKRGKDEIDLIVADNTYYDYYWTSLQTIQRITSDTGSGEAGAGYGALRFKGANVLLDGGYGGSAPAGMFFLNTKHIKFCSHSKRNFVPLEKRHSVNQDAFVQHLVWAGNMTMGNRFLQGRIVP
jgi:hypothetical protein